MEVLLQKWIIVKLKDNCQIGYWLLCNFYNIIYVHKYESINQTFTISVQIYEQMLDQPVARVVLSCAVVLRGHLRSESSSTGSLEVLLAAGSGASLP